MHLTSIFFINVAVTTTNSIQTKWMKILVAFCKSHSYFNLDMYDITDQFGEFKICLIF